MTIVEDSLSPMTNRSLFSLLTFSWLGDIIATGRKKFLSLEDLYNLPESLSAEQIHDSANILLKEELNKPDPSLWNVIWAIHKRDIIVSAVANFLSVVFTLVSPTLIGLLINFIITSQSSPSSPPPEWQGYLIVVAFLIFQVGYTIGNSHNYYLTATVAFKIRQFLITSIYKKSLRLSSAAQQKLDVGKTVNMISTDTFRMDVFFLQLNTLWSSPFQVIVIALLLLSQLGVSALAGFAVFIVLTPLQKKVTKLFGSVRGKVAAVTDKRVKTIQENLLGIKVVKFYGWEKPLIEKIRNIRDEELAYVRKLQITRSTLMALGFVIPIFAMIVSFATFAALGNDLNPAIIFSSLAYFTLMRVPLLVFPTTLTGMAEAKASLARILQFLMLDESEPDNIKKDLPEPENSLEVVDATFAWADTKDEIVRKSGEEVIEVGETFKLKNLNFVIPKGSLVAVVGSVGSGKSSLLSAIIGEMEKSQGSLKISGSVGYCCQTAWIQNSTMRDNITFGQPFDSARYWKVIDDCALEKDIQILEDGDLTEIGERGINLSGGQKQRINLARVAYFDPDVILMDDPLSAVDSHVGKHLFEKCILQRLKSKTRILVTHKLYILSKVDYIIWMEHGEILAQGSYETMMQNERFLVLMKDHGGTSEKQEEEIEISKDTLVEESSELVAVEDTKSKSNTAKKLMTTEEKSEGYVKGKIYQYYFGSAGPVYFICFVMVFLLILTQGLRIGNDLWLALWSKYTQPSSNSSPPAINLSKTAWMGIYIAFGFGQSLVSFINSYYFSIVGVRSSKKLHNSMLDHVVNAPMMFFDTTPLGRIINRFSKDIDEIDNTLVIAMQMFLSTLASAIAIFILVSISTVYFLIPLVPLLMIYYSYQLRYRSSARELKRLDSVTRSPIFAHFSETLSGLSTIRAYNEEKRFITTCLQIMNTNASPYYLSRLLPYWLSTRLETIAAFFVFFAALLFVIFRTTVSPGIVGLSMSYIVQIVGTLAWCVRQFAETETYMNSVERVEYYSSNLPQEKEAVIENCRPPPMWPQLGEIQFDKVSVQYRADLPFVLEDISLSIKSFEKIGVVGRTGAGKSSIMLALFRIVEMSKGTIFIDGVDISSIGLLDLRKRLAIIPQDPVLFSGSVRSNLDPFNERTDDELWKSLERSFLKDYISTLEGGLDGEVALNGDNFSVGQRQLLCLARALLTRTSILVLDEATASVDLETDSLIQEVLRSDFNDCTVLTIAHRLNTVIDYDRILVLESGRVAEFDSPAQLLQNPDSQFSSLVNETGAENAALLRSLVLDLPATEEKQSEN